SRPGLKRKKGPIQKPLWKKCRAGSKVQKQRAFSRKSENGREKRGTRGVTVQTSRMQLADRSYRSSRSPALRLRGGRQKPMREGRKDLGRAIATQVRKEGEH